MRFTVSLLPDHHERSDAWRAGATVSELAATAERLGFDAVFVTDHPAPDAQWLDTGGHQAYEPTVALMMAAAATTTIRLHTHVYVLAYRNPFLAARSLASLDILSDGRLILGVAAGYLRPEFAALGIPFDERNERLDHGLDVIGRVWTGEEVAATGPGWSARGVRQAPVPVSRPRPPIWIGGNSAAAMRRAARSADGWSPFGTAGGISRATKTAELTDLDELAARITRFREMCDEAGRTSPLDICMGAFGLGAYLAGRAPAAAVVDELEQMAALGVTWTAMSLGRDDVAGCIEQMERLAEDVLGPLTSTT